MCEWRIRRASQADVDAVRAIAKTAYAPLAAHLPVRPEPLTVDYRAIIDRGDTWVAERRNRVGGYIVVANANTLSIDNIAVDPAFQSIGLGRRLLAHAEALGVARGFERVRLYTPVAAYANRRWYERHGYIEYDRRIDQEIDRVYFEKQLI